MGHVSCPCIRAHRQYCHCSRRRLAPEHTRLKFSSGAPKAATGTVRFKIRENASTPLAASLLAPTRQIGLRSRIQRSCSDGSGSSPNPALPNYPITSNCKLSLASLLQQQDGIIRIHCSSTCTVCPIAFALNLYSWTGSRMRSPGGSKLAAGHWLLLGWIALCEGGREVRIACVGDRYCLYMALGVTLHARKNASSPLAASLLAPTRQIRLRCRTQRSCSAFSARATPLSTLVPAAPPCSRLLRPTLVAIHIRRSWGTDGT